MSGFKKCLIMLCVICLLVSSMPLSKVAGLDKPTDAQHYAPTVSDVGPSNFWPSNVAWTAATGGGVHVAFTNTSKGYRVGLNVNKPAKLNGLHIGLDNLASSLGAAYFTVSFSAQAQGDPYTQDALILIFTSSSTTGTIAVSSDSGATSSTIISGNALKFANLKDIAWNLEMIKNGDSSYTLTVAGLSGTIPASYITGATLLTNPDSCYVTLGSWTDGSTAFGLDITSLHGGNDICYNITDAQWAIVEPQVQPVFSAISSIGTVTTASSEAIIAARTNYNGLSDYNKNFVSNYNILVAAEQTYANLFVDADYRAYAPATADIGPTNFWPSNVAWTAAANGGVNVAFTNTSKGYRVGLDVNKTVKMDGLHINFDNLKSNLDCAYFMIALSNLPQGDSLSQDTMILMFSSNNSTGSVDVSSDNGNTSTNVMTSDKLKFPNLKDIAWKVAFNKNMDNSYSVSIAGVTGVIPASFVTNATALTNPDSCYATFGSWSAGSTSFSIDVAGIHGGSEVCYGATAAIDIERADEVNALIAAIGTVTLESGTKIKAARSAYDALSAYRQKIVDKYSILTTSEACYNKFLPSISGASIRTIKDEQGLRFYSKIDEAGIALAKSQGYTFVGCGSVLIQENLLFGSELLRSTPFVAESYYDLASLKGAYDYDATMGGTAATHLNKNRNIVARSFIVYEKAGQQVVLYSDSMTKSVYDVALILARKYLLEIFDIDANGNVTAAEKERAFNLVMSGAVGSLHIDNSDVTPSYVPNAQVTMEASDSTGTLTSPDWVKSLIMAEVRIEKATPAGTFQAATGLLDHYKQMGINAIWLTPIYDPGINGNGYGNLGLNTINPKLTGTADYAQGWQVVSDFVTAAHSKNIRVFLDVITWGTQVDSPLYTQHPTWYSGNAWSGKAWNWYNSSLKTWFKTQAQNIITTTNIDGFRCDAEPNVTGYGIFDSIRDTALASGHKIACFAEGSSERRGDYDFEDYGVMDYTRTTAPDPLTAQITSPVQFYLNKYNIVDSVKNGLGLGTQAQQTAGTGGQYRFYAFNVSNHDYGCTMVNGSGLAIGYQAIFAPFIPIWYMGEELGQQSSGQLYMMQLDMTLLNNSANQKFQDEVTKMIRIRRQYPQIFQNYPLNHRTTNICSVPVAGNPLQAYARYDQASGEGIIIVPNKDPQELSYNVTVPFADMGLAGHSKYVVTNMMTTDTVAFGNQAAVGSFVATVSGNSVGVYLVKGTN